MNATTFSFTGTGGKKIRVYQWEPSERSVRGVIQIAHGLAEHAGRYERLAESLAENGFAVLANDHRGHGLTDPESESLGYIDGNDGYQLMVDDIHKLYLLNLKKYAEVPFFLFGHSMGTTLVLRMLQLYPVEPDGVVLSGPLDPGQGLLREGALLASFIGLIYGQSAKSPLINRLTFGTFNEPFEPVRTPFDWLSRDESEVDKYIRDPNCGFVCSASFYRDLCRGIRKVFQKQNLGRISNVIPFYLLAGSEDPAGKMGEGTRLLAKLLQEEGVTDCDVKLYEGGRHEMLNEINRDEVTKGLIQWLERQMKKSEEQD